MTRRIVTIEKTSKSVKLTMLVAQAFLFFGLLLIFLSDSHETKVTGVEIVIISIPVWSIAKIRKWWLND